MKRYLLNISYIGSNFRGIQRTKLFTPEADSSTVQGCLEQGLKALRSTNPIQLTLSSRTDAGVHALHSTVHFDLEQNNNENPYSTSDITQLLNQQLYNFDVPIRVINTVHVPNTFHCRFHAKKRTYLYRFAVSKVSVFDDEQLGKRKYISFIPIEELSRCCYLQHPNFDIEKFNDAASLFLGYHDFRTFMGMNKNVVKKHAAFTLRTITDIKIEPGKPLTSSFDAEKSLELYDYWNIYISGKSFLYRQVRRIVSTLIAVGYNRLTKKDVYEMLTIPSKHSWTSKIVVVPPFGLYLCKVHYNENDLKFPQEETNCSEDKKENN